MSPMLTSLLLLLALVISASAKNSTVKESLKLHLNSSGETSNDDRIKTTENTEQKQDVHHESTTNEVPHKWPGLVFNPPDFFRFPKNSEMARFWQDNPYFKAIPDLPAEDTEYPYWLQVVMGRVRPTTPSLTADNDQVLSSKEDQSERNGESFNSRISPKGNPIEKEETFESNNLPTEPENEPFFPTGNLLKESDQRISEHQSIPNRSNKQHNGPILFRLPLIDSMQNIPERKYLNDPRNINFGNSRTNRFEERPPPDLLVEMLPPDPRFQEIPISIDRPSVLERPGNLMLPIRNQNFRQTNFIPSGLPRPFPIKEQIMESPKPNHPVDSQLSRQPWLELQQEDNDRLQEVPAQSATRHTSIDPKKQFQMISIHKNISLPKQSEINFRAKRQAAFESFDPFAFGNMFSFFPQRKEEPNNSFNWFPQEPMMRTPVRQPPPVNNPQSFIPVRNQRPTNPPMHQPNLPQDAWVISPASSSAGNQRPNLKNQMPPKNHRSNNGQIPDDFLLIQPRNGGNLNDMPWTISNLFGTNPFHENRDGQIWNFQKPFDQNLGIYPRQPTNINQGGFLNNSPWSPFDSERISQPNRENNFVLPPFWQNPPPRQGQEQVQPPREDNSHQAQWNHPFPSQNRNNFVQPPVSQNPPPRQGQEHIQPPRQDNSHPGQWNHPSSSQNRNNIKPSDKQVDVKPDGRHPQFQGDWKPAPEIHAQPKLPPGLNGTWIPKEDSQKKMPNIETEHFQEAPLPQYPKPPNERHHQANNPPSKPVEVPQITEERHRKPIQPEVMKGKRKLSPSEVRHLLSLLPELPKKVYTQTNEKKQNPETSSSITTDSRKRLSPRPVSETDAGNLTRNYPGPIHLNRRDTLSANRHLKSLEFLDEKRRKKRDLEDSRVQDVVFGSYGYQSEHGYEDTESFSYFSRPFFSFPSSSFHNTDEMNGFWSNSYPRGPPGFYHGPLSWPYGFYGHHSDFRHFLPNHGAGLHHNPHHHHHHHHPDQKHGPHDHGHWFPHNQSPFPGGRRVLVIPPAVPRANANQLSYTARFRYRFGIYPGYSDYIPSTDNHEIFFFYDDHDEARRRDAVIPFRSY